MNWKLIFLVFLAVALLVEVDGASRDRKKKKNRNNDDDEEDTTGGGMMENEPSGSKKDDNKDGGREREREAKEKKEKKSEESSSEEDEEKKNGTEVEIPKRFRFRRQLRKGLELNEKKEKEEEDSSSEECCDDKLKKAQEVNGGEKLPLHNRPSLESLRRKRAVVKIPLSIDDAMTWMGRSKRNTDEHVKPRKGLAANPDNHFNQQQRAENPLPKSQTHARQGLAANPENQKREKRDDDGHGPATTQMSMNNPANQEAGAVFTEVINQPQMRVARQVVTENGQLYSADSDVVPTKGLEHPTLQEVIEATKNMNRQKRENELKRATEVNDGLKLEIGKQTPAKAHTHARQGHAANPDNHQH